MKISFERKVNSTTWICGRCGVTLKGGGTRPSGWQRIRQADDECTFWPPVYLRDSDIEEERCNNCSADPRNLEEIARLWDALHQESDAISEAIEELQDILYSIWGQEMLCPEDEDVLKHRDDYHEVESEIRNAIAELYLEKDQYQADLYELEREEAEYKRRYQRSNQLFSRMVND